ncbi:MAG: hypothetical protein RBT33_02400 [Candidatus Dojkabacteria bacterium]|nr:hypothetical protein [Candidatus Dojkabacteria bacterium]
MKKMFVIVILLGSLLLSACTFTLSMDGKEVGSLDPCKVTGVTSDLCAEEAEDTKVDTTVPEEKVSSSEVTGTDTYRGYRMDFPERSVGRILIEKTLVEGPALHQDRDGNVTIVMKNASATFSSGVIWLYKVGDANSLEDEKIFLDNQIKFFNDPSPLWIEAD